jgi:hypothetical protein
MMDNEYPTTLPFTKTTIWPSGKTPSNFFIWDSVHWTASSSLGKDFRSEISAEKSSIFKFLTSILSIGTMGFEG